MIKPEYSKMTKEVGSMSAFLIMASLLIWICAVPAVASPPTRILIMPFTVNSSEDLSFIQKGVSTMLVSRLGRFGHVEVTVLNASREISADLNRVIKESHVDYLIVGSLTVFGDKVSTDAKVISGKDPDPGKPMLFFGKTGQRQSEIIDHIDAFAAQINARLLGRGDEIRHPVQRSEEIPNGTALKRKPETTGNAPISVKAHETDSHQMSPSPTTASTTAASTLVSRPPLSSQKPLNPSGSAPFQLRGLERIKGQINGIASGDLDGNGRPEIVTITNSRLTTYQAMGGRWIKMSEVKSSGNFVGVDTADVNGNGRQEIFVTKFDNTQSRTASFVLEWDGTTMERISNLMPWYFRAVDIDGRGKVLLGQRQGQGDLFLPGIFEITWQDHRYEPGDRLSLPRDLTIFGFASGRLRPSKQMEIVAYGSTGNIQILDPSGNEVEVSIDQYGGSSNAIIFTDEDQWDEQENVYLQQRIHLLDVDHDGIQEMLVVDNDVRSGTGVLARRRFFEKGRLEWLKSRHGGIRSIGSTLDMPRFIADSTVVDIDGDGHLEVVVAVVDKPGSELSEGSGYLAAFATEMSK